MIIRSRGQHIDLSPVSGFFEKESFMNWVAVVDDEEVGVIMDEINPSDDQQVLHVLINADISFVNFRQPRVFPEYLAVDHQVLPVADDGCRRL